MAWFIPNRRRGVVEEEQPGGMEAENAEGRGAQREGEGGFRVAGEAEAGRVGAGVAAAG
jgi:hypothetical protein